jgi:hypothetical protein
MNKKLAIGLGIIGIAAAGIGSVAYIAKSNLEKREQVLSAQISGFKSTLPQQYKFDKVQSESNLFESKGKYVFSNTDSADKSNNGQITIEYRASHGPQAWFGGEIQFVADGKLEGEIVKTYQIASGKNPGVSFKVDGVITEENSIVSKNTVNDFSFVVPVPVPAQAPEHETPVAQANAEGVAVDDKTTTPKQDKDVAVVANNPEAVVSAKKEPTKTGKTGMLVNVKGTTNLFKFSPKTGELQSSINYGSVIAEDLENTADKIVGNNIGISYDSNLNGLDVGTFKFKADKISDGTENMKAEGLEFSVATEQKNQKYNMKLSTKVKQLKVMAQSGSFEIGYSVNGIDKAMVSLSQKIGKAYASHAELSEEEMKKNQEILLNNLKTGFSFKLDKIFLKNDKNQLDFSGQYEIVPTPTGKDFSFQTQSKFGADLKVSGDLAPMAYSIFGSFLGVQTPEAAKEFQFKAGFENGKLKINDKEVEQGINDSILTVLKNVDANFGLIKEATPAVPTNADANAELKSEGVKTETKETGKTLSEVAKELNLKPLQ